VTEQGNRVPEPGIDGRVAFVTGAAGMGIGRVTASRLLHAGASVALVDSHEARTAAVSAELREVHGDRVIGVPLDVTDTDAVDRVVADVADRLGPIQILVNNAAINILGDVCSITPDEWDAVLAVNLKAPWYLTRAVMPGMKAAGSGAIVNVSSIAGDLGADGEAPYAVSKGALNVLTRIVAHAGGPDDIRCNAVAMTLVEDTRFAASDPSMLTLVAEQTPLPRHVQSADIAETIAFLVSDRARNITGEIVNVSAGFHMRP
jgi:3-oxoacyl-[acyl-carrier protein] reductase